MTITTLKSLFPSKKNSFLTTTTITLARVKIMKKNTLLKIYLNHSNIVIIQFDHYFYNDKSSIKI